MLNKKKLLTGIVALTTGAMLLSGTPLAEAKNNKDHGEKRQEKAAFINLFGRGGLVAKDAEVTGISSSTLNAKVVWNDQTINFTITTDSNTKVTIGDNKGSVSDIKVGDKIMVQGSLTTWALQPTVYAKHIVVKKSDGEVTKPTEVRKVGRVVSVDTAAKTFVVTGLSGTSTTVTTNASTTFIVNGNATGSITDVQANSVVMVQGTSTSAGTFLASKVVIGWKKLGSLLKHLF